MSKKSKDTNQQDQASGSADASEFDYARETSAEAPKAAAQPGRSGKPSQGKGGDAPSASDESEFKYGQKRTS